MQLSPSSVLLDGAFWARPAPLGFVFPHPVSADPDSNRSRSTTPPRDEIHGWHKQAAERVSSERKNGIQYLTCYGQINYNNLLIYRCPRSMILVAMFPFIRSYYLIEICEKGEEKKITTNSQHHNGPMSRSFSSIQTISCRDVL